MGGPKGTSQLRGLQSWKQKRPKAHQAQQHARMQTQPRQRPSKTTLRHSRQNNQPDLQQLQDDAKARREEEEIAATKLTAATKQQQTARSDAQNARIVATHATQNKLKAVDNKIDSEMRAASVAKDEAMNAKQSEIEAENHVKATMDLANNVAILAPNE